MTVIGFYYFYKEVAPGPSGLVELQLPKLSRNCLPEKRSKIGTL
jgi:hypothetical protein